MIILPVNRSSLLYWWNHVIIPAIVTRAPMTPVSGQGLCSTKWKGWLLCLVIMLLL
jgi:hypothetical protein